MNANAKLRAKVVAARLNGEKLSVVQLHREEIISGALIVATLVLALSGCGAQAPMKAPPSETANSVGFGGPRKFIAAKTQSVVIIGDSIVNAWLTPAVLSANPTWTAQGTPEGVVNETAAEVLLRFPAAVALKPALIVIEVGVWDMAELSDQIGITPCESTSNPCGSIAAMLQEAKDANIPAIVCTVPPWGVGPSAVENGDAEVNLQHITDISDFNQYILGTGNTIDMYALLFLGDQGDSDDDEIADLSEYNPLYTTDGVTPNAAGGQVMTTALQAVANTSTTELR